MSKNLRNKTLLFFQDNPGWVSVIDIALISNYKWVHVIKGRLNKNTLAVIGDELGITRERVRQLEEDSLIRIKGFIKRFNNN